MIKPLKSEKKIETIFEKGALIKNGVVLLRFHDFKDDEVSFGVSVPKKNFKSAVSRNRIKRQLREIVRNNPNLKQMKKGVSFFLIYSSSKATSFEELNKKSTSLIEKLISKFN